MDLVVTLTIVLLSVGAIQGLVVGTVLLRSDSPNRTANRFLAAILFLFAYRLLVQIVAFFGVGDYDGWYYVLIDLSWVNGPLLYFYVLALVRPRTSLRKKDGIHFLPVTLQVCMSVFVRLQNLYWDGTRESLTWAGYWGYVVWMNYPTIYIVASLLIVGYAIAALRVLQVPEPGVMIDLNQAQWIKRIVLSFALYFALVCAVLVVDLIAALGTNYYYFTRFFYYPFFGGLSILTYWIGIEGYRRMDAQGLIIKREASPAVQLQLNDIASRLERMMEDDKLFTDPHLSLHSVADRLDVKPYLLSRSLNETLDSRFNDYINALRVKEVKRLVQDPENDRYTLLSLAIQAGFNSKSSFNRSVKKHLGIPPGALRARPCLEKSQKDL